MATVKGLWEFNETLTYTNAIEENVTFTIVWGGTPTTLYLIEIYKSSSGTYFYGKQTSNGPAYGLYTYKNSTWGTNSRVFDFGETDQIVSDEFYAWLTANAVKKINGIRVDLSALNLSVGTHTITVKAKADGYMSSPPSNAIEYTKGG